MLVEDVANNGSTSELEKDWANPSPASSVTTWGKKN